MKSEEPTIAMDRPPDVILQRVLDYIAARYGGTEAHHIAARALRSLRPALPTMYQRKFPNHPASIHFLLP